MASNQKKIGIGALALGAYVALCLLARWDIVPTSIRYGICSVLNLVLIVLVTALLAYLAYNAYKSRRLDSILALVFVALIAYFLGPIWMKLSYNFACSAVSQQPEAAAPAPVIEAAPTEVHNEPVVINNKTEFEQKVLASSKPVILKASATWCPPCQMSKPIFEKLAGEMGDKVMFAEVDVDQFPDGQLLNVQALPTFIGYKNGKEVSRFAGFRERQQLKQEIEKLL